MSLTATRWAWSVTGLAAGSKLVLLALADHADDDGRCWPAQDRLSEMTGLSRATVQRSLVALEELDLLTREPGSGRRSTRYTLAVEGPHHEATTAIHTRLTMRPQGPHHEAATNSEGPHHEAPGASSCAPRGLTMRPEPPRTVIEPSPQPPALSQRALDIAGRAGELHAHAQPDARSPKRLARWKANELTRATPDHLEALAALDVELDVAARAALDGTTPTTHDPRGVWVDGAGWCAYVEGAATA